MKRTGLAFVGGVVCTLAVLMALVTTGRSAYAPAASSLAGFDSSVSYEAAEMAAPPMEEGLGMRGTGPGGGGLGSLGAKNKKMAPSRAGSAAPAPMQAAPKGMAEDAFADGSESEESEPEGDSSAPSRSWFPETFLFEPLIVTNDQGEASVPVRIPDRLTNWRVLALAHAQSGEQAGAVTSFQGTLPVYVEPVLPGFLVSGDELRLPLQVVNTTESTVGGTLTFEVDGARVIENPSGTISVPPQGSLLRYAVVRADKAGTAIVRARFGKADALVKELPVMPAGRPVTSSAGGTLAAPREVDLSPPSEAVAGTTRVRLTVFPGALALLRNELGAASLRGGPADDAYGLLLAGRADDLLENLGESADADSLRKTTIVLQQRALRHTRGADGATAALFTEAALSHPENPVLSRLGERLAMTVAASQRPDGTFQGGEGWTLQRLLVATADGTRAIASGASTDAGRKRATAAKVRASGAFERYLAQVTDGYTAAAIVASGAVSGDLAQQLRAKVRTALVSHADGSRSLTLEEGVTRADGQRPSVAEATALAILALRGDDQAPVADLGAFLLGSYSPAYGWGDGRTNLAALQAVLEVFKERIPSQVRVVLERDGKVVTEGTISPDTTKDVVTMEAAAPATLAAGGKWTVRAEPAVPGLGYRLELASWVPWKKEASSGLELAVVHPASFKVGEAAVVQVTAAGPSGTDWSLRAALPAGVQVDRPALEEQVVNGVLNGYELEDGAVTLKVPSRGPGQPFVTSLRVFPTLGGRLNAGASTLSVDERPDWVAYSPTPTWTVR